MAIQTQFRRGNTYSHSLFTGASGEITVDLDKKVAVVHDGATVGGYPLSLNSYTAAAFNQANTASTIAGLAFNAANVAAAFTVAGATGNISNIQLAAGITTSGLLTTANISELTNLYFTNARSRASISIASGNVNGKGSYNSATGVLSINAANVTVSSSAPTDPYIGDVWIHADTAVEYLYFSDGTSFQWAEISAAGTGGSSSNYGDSNVILLGYATNSNVALKANVVDLTTANVTEATNLYFTNARVYSNVTQLGYITSSSLSGYATNTQLSTYATNAQLTSYATTTNVALKANVVDLTSANVTEVTNQYFTNARAIAAVTNTTLSNITVSGNVSIGGELSVTGNVTGTNLTSKTSGSWTVTTGVNTYSITVPINGNYQIWVRANIPNGIIAYQATVAVTNSNVPVLGSQRAWNYTGGGSPILLTSMPTQIVGTEGTISTTVVSTTTANRLDFGINNSSGSSQTVYWGYVTL